MLWVPQKGIKRVEHNVGSVGATTYGTSVTTGASAGTKGTPAELFASTSFDAYGVYIIANGYGSSTANSGGCLDILIGAATEEVLIPNLLFGQAGHFGGTPNTGPKRWFFPLYIPAGSRIAAQAAGRRTSTAFKVGMYLFGGDGVPPWRTGSKVTTYGISAVPTGTAITAGASGAEGSWTEITSSTSENHFALVPSLQSDGEIAALLRGYTADIAIGAAAAEEEIASGFLYLVDTTEGIGGPDPAFPIFQDIPSSTRLSMRLSGSGTVDSFDAAIHAVS